MPPKVKCDCVDRFPESLWSYRDDDWYCPQCGRPLCWLWSMDQYPLRTDSAPEAHSEIWVYPTGENRQFMVSLRLNQPHDDRTHLPVSPGIVSAELDPADQFTVKVHDPEPGGVRRVELIPVPADEDAEDRSDANRTPPGGKLSAAGVRLHEQGNTYSLTLVGNFPTTVVKLRVCNAPELSWSVRGRGIGSPTVGSPQTWLVLRNEKLEFDLYLHSKGAPVKLDRSTTLDQVVLLVDDDSVDWHREIVTAPLPGAEFSAHAPGHWRLRVGFSPFSRVDQVLLLQLRPELVNRTSDSVPDLTFKYVPAPVSFDPAEGLVIPEMYWGEIRSNDWSNFEDNPDDSRLSHVISQLHLTNHGDKPIKLNFPQPVREPATDRAQKESVWSKLDWLTVNWLNSAQAGKVIELQPGQTAPLFVRIDLSGVARPAEVDPTRALAGPRATIRVSSADKSDYWETSIYVAQVRHRTPCPYPLAIDFGNSCSYAAVLNRGELVGLEDMVLAVHGCCGQDVNDPDDPSALGGERMARRDEAFPTTLSVRHYVAHDPLQSDFVIGRAVDRSDATGDAAVRLPLTDLKRWIELEGGDAPRQVSDEGPVPHDDVRPSTLVQMYLFGLIRRAEAVLRRFYISRVVVSYPAKRERVARQRYEDLVIDLCGKLNSLPGRRGQSISYGTVQPDDEPYGVDEANAVATGFVLNPPAESASAKPKLQFVVAAFDLGGGSLDTALLRFTDTTPDSGLPTYHSKYLLIGGQADFGGDNVTVAVFEILRQKVSAAEGGAALLKDVPTPNRYQSLAGHSRWLYEVLWGAAEQLKQWLCDAATGSLQSLKLRFCDFRCEPTRALQQVLERLLADPAGRPTLEQVYQHSISCDHRGKGNYSVGDRIRQAIGELVNVSEPLDFSPGAAWTADVRKVEVDYVVLGGRGSRLPLVRDLLEQQFGKDRVVFHPETLKCLVAEGLVSTVDYLDSVGPVLARSGKHTPSSIGVLVGNIPIVLIPACTPIDPDLQFPFRTRDGKALPLQRAMLVNKLVLFTSVGDTLKQNRLGVFDLSHLAGKLPTEARPFLRFGRNESDLMLVVTDRDGVAHSIKLT